MEETDASSDVKLGLDLGLGLTKYEPKLDNSKKNKKFFLDLSIPLHRSDIDHDVYSSSSCIEDKKRTRKNGIFSGCKEDDHDMNYSDDCSRKKLRLSKNQITLLEDSFGQHSTLTMVQKQALAEKLNLKSRQVEVWFQNRRARTKLKQTEIDCEFLKKKFERLSDENQRLHNQLLEFRSAAKMEKSPSPQQFIFQQMPKESANFRTCSSCDQIFKSGGRKKEAAAVDSGDNEDFKQVNTARTCRTGL